MQPQQLLAASTLLPQQSLLASTPQQLFPAAILPPQQLLPTVTLPLQQPAAATLPPQQLTTYTLLPQQLVAAATLPPVWLHQQIVQGEYVDFNIFLAKTTFVGTMGQPSSSQQPAVIKILLFTTWMEARNIYMSI